MYLRIFVDRILITRLITNGLLVPQSASRSCNFFEYGRLLARGQLLWGYLLLLHHRGMGLRRLWLILLLFHLLVRYQFLYLLIILERRFRLRLLRCCGWRYRVNRRHLLLLHWIILNLLQHAHLWRFPRQFILHHYRIYVQVSRLIPLLLRNISVVKLGEPWEHPNHI